MQFQRERVAIHIKPGGRNGKLSYCEDRGTKKKSQLVEGHECFDKNQRGASVEDYFRDG